MPVETARSPARLISIAQVAAELGVSERTARRLHAAAKLPDPRCQHLGRGLRWRWDEIQAWIEAEAPPAAEWRLVRDDRLADWRRNYRA